MTLTLEDKAKLTSFAFYGLSDGEIGKLLGYTKRIIRYNRIKLHITPNYKYGHKIKHNPIQRKRGKKQRMKKEEE